MNTIRILILSICLLSCNFVVNSRSREYNPFGTELHKVRPEREAVVKETRNFSIHNTEGMAFYTPAAVHESILVTCLIGAYTHIAAVNAQNGRIIGNYIPSGSGNGMIVTLFTECQYTTENGDFILYLYDVGQNQIYSYNLTDAVSNGSTSLISKGKLPQNPATVSCLDNSTNLITITSADGNAIVETIDFNGNVLKSWNLFPKAEASMLRTFLSNRVSPNHSGTKAAIAMTFLPQLNILDLTSGKKLSVLYDTDTDLKLLAEEFSATEECPDDTFTSRLFTTDELIYIVRTHYAETESESDYTELLIFGWDGSFKYRLKIDNIFTGTALDTENNILYGGEGMSTVHVYDFSSCL